jgi:hypothetical protein
MAKEEKVSAEKVIRDIRRETRRKYSAEEKIVSRRNIRDKSGVLLRDGFPQVYTQN